VSVVFPLAAVTTQVMSVVIVISLYSAVLAGIDGSHQPTDWLKYFI